MRLIGANIRYTLLFLFLFGLSFIGLKQLSNYTYASVSLSNSHSTFFKIYWTTRAEPTWSENNSAAVYANNRKKHHILPLSVPLSKIDKLRIDPSTRKGVKTTIRDISFYHIDSRTLRFNNKKAFSTFRPNDHVSEMKVGPSLTLISAGNDAGFLVDIPTLNIHPRTAVHLGRAFLLALFLFGFISLLPWLIGDLKWVPASMLLISGAVLVMATLSKNDQHPDEVTHITNAEFYVDRYAPPESCSAETRYTYTTYGVSRLDNREIAYYVGGRYLQLVDFIPSPDYIKLRYLNVGLFLFLTLLAFRQVKARILFLPLLLTPQAWYLFAYYNSDALSLFAVVLAAYQVFVPESMLRRLINGERPPGYFLWVLLIAVTVALQYWVKLNYIFYPLFLVMLAVSWWLVYRRKPNFRDALPVVIACVIGTSLFLSWEVSRHAVNDFSLNEKAYSCREMTAGELFKPSTPLAKTHPTFRLREKGETLLEMVTQRKWAERIFYTGLGTYGYTEYLNSYTHYEIASILIIMFFLYAVLIIVIRGNAMSRLSVLSMIAAMCGITLAAAINNWDQDFQPQGRYLMVYLPLFGSILAMHAQKLNMGILSALALGPFLLALYSFFAVALTEIPKI